MLLVLSEKGREEVTEGESAVQKWYQFDPILANANIIPGNST